jgi:hypothetical protein
MNAVDRRIVELAIIGKHRPLSATEAREWEESRRYVIDREWKLARILNLMQLARQTKDWTWAMQLAEEYDKVMKLY